MQFTDENTIVLDKVGRTKKLTATRFATIFGLNAWNTPFSAWCEITKTYEPPFEESQYTLAGKIIEGKIIKYLRKRYFMDIKDPTDVYGADYFKKTYGDFFKDQKVLGGMWDAIGEDFVVEIKTTKRAEDWMTDVPIYYKLQAALYTYLLGYKRFVVPVCFLSESDYPKQNADGTWDTSATDNFKPSVDNIKIYEFELDAAFPNFEDNYVKPALAWWEEHIVGGVSPQFDEKKDAEILKVLRKNTIAPTDKEIKDLLAKSEELEDLLTQAYAIIKPHEDEKKEVDEKIKKYMQGKLRDGDKQSEIQGSSYVFTLTMKKGSTGIDKDKLKADGLLEKYQKVGNPTYALNINQIKNKTEEK